MLRLVAGRVPLLIELKSSPLWPALERAVLDALHGYEGELAIQSSSAGRYATWTAATSRTRSATCGAGARGPPPA